VIQRSERAALALLVLLEAPALAAAAGPQRPSKQYSIEQFMNTTSVSGASFSADESRILFSSNQTGIFNAYSVPVGGGPAVAVTRSTSDTTTAISYFPADDRILYTRDQGGDENNHLYVRERDGTERDLTPGDELKARFAGWTRDGSAFYVLSNDRDARFFDLYRHDAASYERRLVFKDEVGYDVGAVSGDERWIALQKPGAGTADSDIYLWDATRNEVRHLTPHEGMADHEPQEFDPESKFLYYLSNDGSEFTRVRRYDLAAGTHEDVEKADWDVLYTTFSHNGRYRVTAVNDDGRTVVRIQDVRAGRTVALPKLPEGDITTVRIARSETAMAFHVNGDRAPSNLYVWRFGDSAATRLTDTLNPEVDAQDLVETEVVRFESFDGTQIPSIFYKPHQATPEAKAPALVYVHGGPGGQTRKGYSALLQYLANHGYVILGINNRGSSGYGKSFYTADDGKHGREPLWDCVEGKKYLASLPYVDKDRIGIMGGSYGGYMVLAALAYQPDVFALGVDIFGVANWIRTLESIPAYWESFRLSLYKEIGDPGRERKKLEQTSPLFAADRIRKPLIVLQGANDPRVIKPESDDIVAAVKKNGVPVEYVVFPDEGHGFTKRKNQIEGYGKIREFLDRYLKAG
jgi:dipeptidyl aminopeptidase/acylaminoacyl peptidase